MVTINKSPLLQQEFLIEKRKECALTHIILKNYENSPFGNIPQY
jgi:hypothetical protein